LWFDLDQDSAAGVIMLLPVLPFLVCKRRFVDGIAATGASASAGPWAP
jgi:hypothetical protein